MSKYHLLLQLSTCKCLRITSTSKTTAGTVVYARFALVWLFKKWYGHPHCMNISYVMRSRPEVDSARTTPHRYPSDMPRWVPWSLAGTWRMVPRSTSSSCFRGYRSRTPSCARCQKLCVVALPRGTRGLPGRAHPARFG